MTAHVKNVLRIVASDVTIGSASENFLSGPRTFDVGFHSCRCLLIVVIFGVPRGIARLGILGGGVVQHHVLVVMLMVRVQFLE